MLCRVAGETKTDGLDLFISMAGQVRSGEHDVSADKYRHLGEFDSAEERRAREKHLLDEAQRNALASEANRDVLTELAKR